MYKFSRVVSGGSVNTGRAVKRKFDLFFAKRKEKKRIFYVSLHKLNFTIGLFLLVVFHRRCPTLFATRRHTRFNKSLHFTGCPSVVVKANRIAVTSPPPPQKKNTTFTHTHTLPVSFACCYGLSGSVAPVPAAAISMPAGIKMSSSVSRPASNRWSQSRISCQPCPHQHGGVETVDGQTATITGPKPRQKNTKHSITSYLAGNCGGRMGKRRAGAVKVGQVLEAGQRRRNFAHLSF